MTRQLRTAWLALVLFAALAAPAWAQKTDIVTLANGDKITCEVKLLDRGRLRVDTDDLGTVYAEWATIASVTTAGTFQVETSSGLRLLGRLATSRPGSLDVVTATTTIPIDMVAVVSIAPIGSSFWSKLDGNLDLGMSYTQSSGVGQVNVASSVSFRRPNMHMTLSGSSYFTSQANADDTARHALQFSSSQAFRTQSLWMLLGGFESNAELGFDLRSTVSAGFGHYLVRSNSAILATGVGLSVNEELPVDGAAVTNLDGLLSIRQSYFTYNYPKTNMSLSLDVFPGLSQWGRVRLEFNGAIKREIIRDFTVGFTIYDSYDNKPPTADARKNDVGLSLTAGWSF
jgi:putative salt-induced outer membrane protein YdiY